MMTPSYSYTTPSQQALGTPQYPGSTPQSSHSHTHSHPHGSHMPHHSQHGHHSSHHGHSSSTPSSSTSSRGRTPQQQPKCVRRDYLCYVKCFLFKLSSWSRCSSQIFGSLDKRMMKFDIYIYIDPQCFVCRVTTFLPLDGAKPTVCVTLKLKKQPVSVFLLMI